MNTPSPHYLQSLLHKRLLNNDGCMCVDCYQYRYNLYLETLKLTCPERIQKQHPESYIGSKVSSSQVLDPKITFKFKIVDEIVNEKEAEPEPVEEIVSKEELHIWKMKRLYGDNWEPD